MTPNSKTWLDDLPADHVDRISHYDLALQLMTRPGQWKRVGTYASRGGASAVASTIRNGRRPAWRRHPAGRFEAEPRTTRTGRHHVYARWIPREEQ